MIESTVRCEYCHIDLPIDECELYREPFWDDGWFQGYVNEWLCCPECGHEAE